jgi:hypothetical protein
VTVNKQHYCVGWNDIWNGIYDWTPHEQWAGPKEWVKHMHKVAKRCLQEGKHNQRGRAYLYGAIDCILTWQQKGTVDRKDYLVIPVMYSKLG